MTRFARADGAKGSNKRTLEEATPWSEMVKQRKDVKHSKGENTSKSPTKKKSPKKPNHDVSDQGCIETNNNSVKSNNTDTLKINKKKQCRKSNKRKNEEDGPNMDAGDVDDNIGPSKNILTKEDTKNDKLNLHENELSEVKPKKKKKEKSNDCDEIDLSEGVTKKKKKKEKAETEKNTEFTINTKGQRMKVFKDGTERTYFDLPYEEGERMLRYEGFWIKRDDLHSLDELKESLKDSDEHTIMKKMMKAKRNAHKKLRIELIYEQKNILKSENIDDVPKRTKKDSKKDKKQTNKFGNTIKHKNVADNKSSRVQKYEKNRFQEDNYMTCYDGYWIRRAAVDKLDAMKTIRYNQIVKKRADDDKREDLNKEETILYQRALKKEKRNEAQKLRSDFNSSEDDPSQFEEYERYQPQDSVNFSYNMMKYDGFWVKKEVYERLMKLKEKLLEEGISEEDVSKVIKTERRKEEKSRRRENSVVCFSCRENGHTMANCTNVGTGANTIPVVGICFKCGSTEHKAFDCNAKNKSEFAYASCFICGETGHISRSCPDNPKGLYPRGGCCNTCGSVEHLAKDCPDNQEENQLQSIKLQTIDGDTLEGLGNYEEADSNIIEKHSKSKSIIF